MTLLLAACGANKESPVIYFSNIGEAPIKDIQCNWAGNILTSLPSLSPGDSRSQSFYISGASDFFGAVNISWTNDSGEKIAKEINFKKRHLSSIHDSGTYNYVQIYLDQEDLEIVSSDAPDLSGKISKMEKLLNKVRETYQNAHASGGQTSLITTQSGKDKSVPRWIAVFD